MAVVSSLAALGTAVVGATTAAGMSTGALATVGAVSALGTASAVAGATTSIVNATKSNKGGGPTYNAEAEKKKIAEQNAKNNKARLQAQTQTVLTQPLNDGQTLLGN